jgi:transcriptional regulator with XRE-family HTH domain
MGIVKGPRLSGPERRAALIRRIEAVGPVFDYMRVRGLSLQTVADALGISKPRLVQIQNGSIAVPEVFVARFADVLGVPLERIYAASEYAREEARWGKLAG